MVFYAQKILRKKKIAIAKAVQRRRSTAHAPDHPSEPAQSGYPLYLTVPVTN